MNITRLSPSLCACVYTFTVLPDGTEQLIEYERTCERHLNAHGSQAFRHAAIVEESQRFNAVVSALEARGHDGVPDGRITDEGDLEVAVPLGHRAALRSAFAGKRVVVK